MWNHKGCSFKFLVQLLQIYPRAVTADIFNLPACEYWILSAVDCEYFYARCIFFFVSIPWYAFFCHSRHYMIIIIYLFIIRSWSEKCFTYKKNEVKYALWLLACDSSFAYSLIFIVKVDKLIMAVSTLISISLFLLSCVYVFPQCASVYLYVILGILNW